MKQILYIVILGFAFTVFGASETGKVYKNKVTYKAEDSKKHPDYIDLSITTNDKSITKETLARIQFIQIAMYCKEKHFHAMIENLPEDGKAFSVIRCKADNDKDDQDKKEAGLIPHKKEILDDYCVEPETDDEKKDSWLNDPEIKKMCDKYRKMMAKTKS